MYSNNSMIASSDKSNRVVKSGVFYNKDVKINALEGDNGSLEREIEKELA